MKLNNLRDTFIIIKFTMQDILSRKSFRISTALIVIFIILGFNVPNILNSFDKSDFNDTILISDPESQFTNEVDDVINNSIDTTEHYKLELTQDNLDAIKEKINNGEASSAILITKDENTILFDYYVKNTATSSTDTLFKVTNQIESLYVNQQIDNLHLPSSQLQSIRPVVLHNISQTDDQEIGGNIFVMMILSCILFFAIYFCAYQVSSSITVEKTSKIIETLVTSTSPRNIVLGKTIGIGLVGLLQIILFAITALISAYSFLDSELLDALFNLSSFTPYLAAMMVLYFILGYFAYALLYALTGSTVSKPEDIQSANMPVAFITMIGFYLAYFTLTNPTGELNLIAAILPISSPFCMPLRIMMGIASGWEVALSILVLIAFCAIIAHIAIKIYSNAILNYGTKTNLKDLVKTYRQRS